MGILNIQNISSCLKTNGSTKEYGVKVSSKNDEVSKGAIDLHSRLMGRRKE